MQLGNIARSRLYLLCLESFSFTSFKIEILMLLINFKSQDAPYMYVVCRCTNAVSIQQNINMLNVNIHTRTCPKDVLHVNIWNMTRKYNSDTKFCGVPHTTNKEPPECLQPMYQNVLWELPKLVQQGLAQEIRTGNSWFQTWFQIEFNLKLIHYSFQYDPIEIPIQSNLNLVV